MEEDDYDRIAERAQRRADSAAAARDDYMHDARDAQVLQLVEEVGEFVSEYQAVTGRKRHKGNWHSMVTELADVYITLKVLSKMLDIDIEDAVASKLVEIQRRGGI